MNILIWTLSIGIVLFQFADFWTTKKILESGGYESNKLEAWLMGLLGVIPALILTKGYVAIFALTGAWFGWWKLYWHEIPLLTLLIGLFGLYGAVVNHNLEQYKKG